jgi:HopA1 effector protein family
VSDFRRAVGEAIAATEVLSPTSYAWFGTRSGGLGADAERELGRDGARSYLLHSLQARLYADFYCAGGARPESHGPELPAPAGGSSFLSALSAANRTLESREAGWTVVGLDGEAVAVRSQDWGLTLSVKPGDVYLDDGQELRAGARVTVAMPKELLRLAPGYYMALSEAGFAANGGAGVVRFYWNLRSDAAPALVSALTGSLNAEGVGFRLKVVSDALQYSRCDAGVLYTLQADRERVADAVAKTYETVRSALKPAVPALTKRLAPGLALAEDPGERATSFGMSRCALIADAIVEAAERGVDDPGGRLAVAERRFVREGVSLAAPYLNPGSADRYALPLG